MNECITNESLMLKKKTFFSKQSKQMCLGCAQATSLSAGQQDVWLKHAGLDSPEEPSSLPGSLTTWETAARA